MTKLLKAVTYLRYRKGIFPIAILDLEKQEIIIHTESGNETLKIGNINNFRFITKIPILVTPN